jgi:hypothetical protein
MHFCHEELFAIITAAGVVKVLWLWAWPPRRLLHRVIRRGARIAASIFSLTIHTCSRLLPGAGR